MSMLKSLAAFIVSSLFIISVYLAIISYTMGDLVQKENFKSFIQSQLKESVAPQTCEDVCNSQFYQDCGDACNNLNSTELADSCKDLCLNNSQNLKAEQACVQTCLSKTSTSQEYVNKTIDEIYSNKIVDDMSLNDIFPLLKNNILFIVLSLIFGFLLFFVSEKPISKIGNDFVWIAIFLLAVAIIPVFLITPGVSVVKMISDFITQNFYQQVYIGIILLATGIVLIIIGKKKGK